MTGTGADGNQGWAGRFMGLQMLIRNAVPMMEIYAVFSARACNSSGLPARAGR